MEGNDARDFLGSLHARALQVFTLMPLDSSVQCQESMQAFQSEAADEEIPHV